MFSFTPRVMSLPGLVAPEGGNNRFLAQFLKDMRSTRKREGHHRSLSSREIQIKLLDARASDDVSSPP